MFLYANGCSVTHGYGLDASLWGDTGQTESAVIVQQRFSSLVARRLQLEEWNRAKRGGSNDRIVRTTVGDIAERCDGISFALIGITSPYRSELRFGGKYVRMFFDQTSPDGGLSKGFEHCNRFFFGLDASRNEFLAREFLQYCDTAARYGYDELFLAERLLTQILLLQSVFHSLDIPWLLVPVLDIQLSRVARRRFSSLVSLVDESRFLRYREAIEDGWCLVDACRERGHEEYEGHPMRGGHEWMAELITSAIGSGEITPADSVGAPKQEPRT